DSGGSALLEAMARGVPVICLDWAGPGEMVDENSGVKIPVRRRAETVAALAAAIARLRDQPEWRALLARAGRERALAQFRWETKVRWRLLTVLTAREVLDARRRHQEFFIPHPRHETVILFVAAIWRRALSERYREQLSRLYAACADKEALRGELVEAFGLAGA